MACATARKELQLSAKHHRDQAELAEYDAQLSMIGDSALQAADRDAHHFAHFIAAQQDDAKPDSRRHAQLLINLSDEITRLCKDVADIVSGSSDKVMENVKNDILAAQALCKGADTINRANGRDMRAFLGGAD